LKIDEKVFKGEVDVKYFLQKSTSNSTDLIIIFSAFQALGQGPKYNYINTLLGIDCNKLFILDDFGSRGSYYLCKGKDYKIERSVIRLINSIIDEYGFKNITSCGSSKGGYASLYYGIKYGFNNIIAASPQYFLGTYLEKSKSPDVIEFLAGKVNEDEVQYLDRLLQDTVNTSEFKPNIYIHLGEGEYHYTDHVLPLIEKLANNHISYELDLGNYNSHSEVGKFFPKYLLSKISSIYKYPNIISLKPIKPHQQEVLKEVLFTVDVEGNNNKIAWYVYKDNKVLQKFPYKNENKIKITFNEIGTYKVKVFVTNSIKLKTTKMTQPFEVVSEEIRSDFDISIKNISTDQIIKVHQISNNVRSIGNSILEDKFYFYSNLETIDFKQGIDWEYQHPKSPDTYQLYLQSLNVLCHLLNAYEYTGEKKYLNKSIEIFKSWYDYVSTNPENKMVWYDHPTAYRTHNLIYFAIVLKENLPVSKDEFFNLLSKHATYMNSDKNYRKNNHGIMMDRSLILLGITLNHPLAKNWIEKGIWRLKDTFNYSYSPLGVHLENSPDYHSIVRTLFKTIEDFLNKNNLSLGDEVNNHLKLSDEYFKYLVKPDGYLPIIGDTELKYYGTKYKNYDSFHDQNAGISLLQAKDEEKPEHSTWISFVSGFGTITHKHHDDLSFNLHYMGNDIFVDSGKYNYGSSLIRGYMKSPRAHNSLAVKGKKYDFITGNEHNAYTKSFYSSNKMDIVQGINKGYQNVYFVRSLIFLKPNIIILLDENMTNASKNISQYFNLASHIDITAKEINKVTLTSKKEPIEIEQILPIDNTFVHKAETNPPQAIISEKFNEIIETQQIEFNKRAVSGENFLTVIKLGEEAINCFENVEFDRVNRKIHISIKNEDFLFNI
jgi:Heparinase II/III-like protein/Heparinase II/III N-terminus